jgi:hypothetical protein
MKHRDDYPARLNPDLKLSPEQADIVRRRVQPFANPWGIQTCSLLHLLQEAYLQGMADAVNAMECSTANNSN